MSSSHSSATPETPAIRTRRKSGRAVLSDVARLADVSTATVSRVYNEPDKVSPSVRERVLQAATTLNWIPNAAGRALASTRTHIAGAIIPTLDDEVFASQVSGMQAVLAERGITLFLGCSNYDPAQALTQVRAMLARGVEVIAIVGEAHPPELFDALRQARVPYAITYAYREGSPHHCIGFDNRAAFIEIAEHLIELGHRTFAAIFQPGRDNDRVQARVAGVREALARHGIAVRPSHMHEGPATIAFGRQSLRAIWQGGDKRPTAIICGNDQLAIGVLLEAAELGIKVPQQLSVTGFDDVAIAQQIHPSLTTMRVDTAKIGRRAAQYLLDVLDGKTNSESGVVQPMLMVRESTGRVRESE
ncbi:LacI family DNA-binding transcriptional regulator [Paraburkholderia sp. HP33-1]|uniref:LacI family DNA-binding transcriptional regulator n=1 Tax=Paraburkholderia sp. HP33-1 TaxID=2883243 RepID=UPI001F42D314|nr:LacI family DNA-binding transcriptional regulator [Paraburkholderia sp. HP33-1]